MIRKLPAFHRVPVDFGNEPVCPVAIERHRALHRANGFPRFIVQNGKLHVQPRIANPLLPRRSEAETGRRFNLSTFQRSGRQRAFTLVEILVVLVLLSLIVFALMAVFSGIQRAFKASLTQTDTLEGGRAVMDMMASDLATMTPSYGVFNIQFGTVGSPPAPGLVVNGPVNFSATLEAFSSPPSPLYQPLMSSPSGQMRANILENIFILSKGNINGVPSWIATGYSVNTNLADGTLYPLYRFYMTTNMAAGPSALVTMYDSFAIYPNYNNSTNWSHLMDGVVNLTARAYDTNGIWITNGYANPLNYHEQNVYSYGSILGIGQHLFCSNAVPASVQIELGTLEDHTLRHAESLAGVNQSNYLANSIGQVHVFRQRVWIRNLDLTAYQ